MGNEAETERVRAMEQAAEKRTKRREPRGGGGVLRARVTAARLRCIKSQRNAGRWEGASEHTARKT